MHVEIVVNNVKFPMFCHFVLIHIMFKHLTLHYATACQIAYEMRFNDVLRCILISIYIKWCILLQIDFDESWVAFLTRRISFPGTYNSNLKSPHLLFIIFFNDNIQIFQTFEIRKYKYEQLCLVFHFSIFYSKNYITKYLAPKYCTWKKEVLSRCYDLVIFQLRF